MPRRGSSSSATVRRRRLRARDAAARLRARSLEAPGARVRRSPAITTRRSATTARASPSTVSPSDFSDFLNAQPRARVDRARRQARGAADRAARRARCSFPTGCSSRTAAFRSPTCTRALAETGDWNDPRVPHRFRLDARAPEGARKKLPNRVSRGSQFGYEDFAAFCALERAARPAGDAHGARPRPRRRALRDLSRVRGAPGADDRGAVAPARARAVRALRARADDRALGPARCRRSTGCTCRPSWSASSIPEADGRRRLGARRRAEARHERRRPALPELRHDRRRARRVRGLPRGQVRYFCTQPHAGPLARRAACPQCGARFGEPARPPVRPPPAAAASALAATGHRAAPPRSPALSRAIAGPTADRRRRRTRRAGRASARAAGRRARTARPARSTTSCAKRRGLAASRRRRRRRPTSARSCAASAAASSAGRPARVLPDPGSRRRPVRLRRRAAADVRLAVLSRASADARHAALVPLVDAAREPLGRQRPRDLRALQTDVAAPRRAAAAAARSARRARRRAA